MTYQVGNAGTVIVQVVNGQLELLAVVPSPGVIAAVSAVSPSSLAIAFSAPAGAGTASITFTLMGTQLSSTIKG